MYYIIVELHCFDILNAYIVLYVKNKEDVLAGFSKLDDLLKVSVFQIYKDKHRESRK